jgi:hypothetical protein
MNAELLPLGLSTFALFFGTVYAVIGGIIGWYFIRKLTSKSRPQCFVLAAAIHCVSTIIAFFILPTAAYLISKNDWSWQIAGAFSIFSGLPSAATDLVILHLFCSIPISRTSILVVWLWKQFTFLGCLGAAFLYLLAATILTSDWPQ